MAQGSRPPRPIEHIELDGSAAGVVAGWFVGAAAGVGVTAGAGDGVGVTVGAGGGVGLGLAPARQPICVHVEAPPERHACV